MAALLLWPAFALLSLAVFYSTTVSALLHQSLTQELLDTSFDYIIIGGGAGGAVLANRLSENSDISVLLIEAGSSDFENIDIEIPSFGFTLSGTQFDWNFTTTPQAGFNNRSIEYARGHVLGGSTAINLMDFCRGTRDDYARWVKATGDSGWSWESLFPYMLKVDRITPPADGHNDTGQFIPVLHGSNGMVNTSVAGFGLPTDALALNASAQLSSEFPFNQDYNSGDTIGISWVQSTIFHGARMTAAQAYIVPALSRPNLQVVVNTLVTKLLQTSSSKGTPAFRGVEIQLSPNQPKINLTASKELILSAGAVKSPHLLMLSGIGDAAHLKSAGVSVIVDIPDVGQNLQDHILLPIQWTTQTNNTLDQLTENETFANAALDQWETSHTGPLVINSATQFGWFRLPDDSPAFRIAPDPSAGPTSAHYELILTDSFVSLAVPPPSSGGFFTAVTNLISPASRGTISLASLDPFAQPVINPSFLSAPIDIVVLREAVKAARRFMSAPAWSDWIADEFGDFANATTDAEIEEFARNTGNTVNHVTGTVAMGRRGCVSRGCGALNPDLTVKGTTGLRVVDASAFPFIISGHTQGATYILAERASDLIKAAAHST